MVFHMLRRMIGDDLFYQSLRKFYKEKIWQQASWKDIQKIFEETGKMDLAWFFEQWVNQAGAPFIELGKTEVEKSNDGWLTKVEIVQTCPQTILGEGNPYRLFLPIHLELDDGNFDITAQVKEKNNIVSVHTNSQPKRIHIDPQCDIFRRLHLEEIPPTIDLVLGDADKVFVYPTCGENNSQAAYKKLAEFLADGNAIVKSDAEIMETDLTQKSLFILGGLTENKLAKIFLDNLPDGFSLGKDSFTAGKTTYNNKNNALLVTFKNSKNKKKSIALFSCLNSGTIKTVGAKIPHYGKYSYLVFAEEKNIDKGTFAVIQSPLQQYLKN